MKRNSCKLNRRQFMESAATAASVATGYWIAGRGGGDALGAPGPASWSPNSKLNIACIGCGGMGAGHVKTAAGQRLVALCDVDEVRAADAFRYHPETPKFKDFRRLFDKMHKEIDAVFVATPDHVHAVASIAAMKLGKHVYCQKPLAHSIWEVREMARVAAETKVATQMGNQGHSAEETRSLVEVIRSGVIGRIREAHAWCPKSFAATGRPQGSPPVPATLDWDLWLGPAPQRPYNPAYLPFNWRAWWDFGTGGLGDMACHVMDPVFWGLELTYPTAVEAVGEPKPNAEGFARDLTVKYEYAGRGDADHQQPVTFYWHHGNDVPQRKPLGRLREFELPAGAKLPNEGVLLVGEKGLLVGAHEQGVLGMYPAEKFAGYKPPPQSLPQSPGHERQWMQACSEIAPNAPGSNFDYAAKLSETVLLGNLAWKVGKQLEWDAKNMRAANAPEAEPLIKPKFREGWGL